MKNIKFFAAALSVVFSITILSLAGNAFAAGWRGTAPAHSVGWYGWHNVKGAREYFPNLTTVPRFTMGAPAVSGKIYHAIYIIDSANKVRMNKIIDNITNALNDPRIKGHVKIELMAFSAGSHIYFKGNGREKALLKLKKMGVELAQCANSLYEGHIPVSRLYHFIKIVPSAQGEIILRESEGYALLKP